MPLSHHERAARLAKVACESAGRAQRKSRSAPQTSLPQPTGLEGRGARAHRAAASEAWGCASCAPPCSRGCRRSRTSPARACSAAQGRRPHGNVAGVNVSGSHNDTTLIHTTSRRRFSPTRCSTSCAALRARLLPAAGCRHVLDERRVQRRHLWTERDAALCHSPLQLLRPTMCTSDHYSNSSGMFIEQPSAQKHARLHPQEGVRDLSDALRVVLRGHAHVEVGAVDSGLCVGFDEALLLADVLRAGADGARGCERWNVAGMGASARLQGEEVGCQNSRVGRSGTMGAQSGWSCCRTEGPEPARGGYKSTESLSISCAGGECDLIRYAISSDARQRYAAGSARRRSAIVLFGQRTFSMA